MIRKCKRCCWLLWVISSAPLLAWQAVSPPTAVDLGSADDLATSVGQRIAMLRDGHYASSLAYHCALFDAYYRDDRLLSWQLLRSWKKLADVYPPAQAALLIRLQWLGDGLFAGTEPDIAVAMYARVARALACPGEVVGTVVALPPMRRTANLMGLVTDALMDTWLRIGAYGWVSRYGDLVSHLRRLHNQVRMAERQGMGATGLARGSGRGVRLPGGGSLPTGTSATHIRDYAQVYAVLLVGGYHDQAREIAAKALALRNHSETRNQLAWAGYQSGKAGAAPLAFARQAWLESDGQQAGYANTYARLLWATGKRAEARRVLAAGLRVADRHAEPLLLATQALFHGA